MNALLDIPLAYRLAGLFLLGAAVGGLLNWAIYCFAWSRRWISPWSRPPEGVAARRWSDRIPIVGWINLQRESSQHGAGFWIRPLLIEAGFGFALAWLYWWEIERQALVALWVDAGGMFPIGPLPDFRQLIPISEAALHAPYLAHALLLALMTVATFIDADEKTIPDLVTVPGTWLGLLLAAVLPYSLLPGVVLLAPDGSAYYEFLHLASPQAWPAAWWQVSTSGQLLIALGCFLGWNFALLPRVLRLRRGWRRGLALMFARIGREGVSIAILLQALVGCAAIAGVWLYGGPAWMGLLSALVGLAAGGGIIWCVRLIGTFALGREAMGFGDVTLMAMIGTFVGWQPCLMIFFLAPVAGLVLGLLQYALRRDNEIPYGPFLCLATVVVIVFWTACWDWLWDIYAIGFLVPAAMAVCLVMMGVLLSVWQAIKNMLFGMD